MQNYSVLLLIALLCAVITCGCTVPSVPPVSSGQPVTTASQPAAVQSAAPVSNGIVKHVIIIQRAFDPDQVTISPGTTVVWTNEDTVSHRVVHLPELPSDRELFHSELLSRGDTFRYTFQSAGRYYYSDPQYAGGRKALVIVE
ncbi:MAG TPA: plastocyanin/azurin family copper-binding protein [Methanoregula sp.]|nr:plastocyanin/azurin family copper-binding protein [Methanoregula sp.]